MPPWGERKDNAQGIGKIKGEQAVSACHSLNHESLQRGVQPWRSGTLTKLIAGSRSLHVLSVYWHFGVACEKLQGRCGAVAHSDVLYEYKCTAATIRAPSLTAYNSVGLQNFVGGKQRGVSIMFATSAAWQALLEDANLGRVQKRRSRLRDDASVSTGLSSAHDLPVAVHASERLPQLASRAVSKSLATEAHRFTEYSMAVCFFTDLLGAPVEGHQRAIPVGGAEDL